MPPLPTRRPGAGALSRDVKSLVFLSLARDRATRRLQATSRRMLLRLLFAHRRTKDWPRLFAALQATREWPLLEPYAQVRKEWRIEPESWLFVMANRAGLLPAILRECEAGLWGTPHPWWEARARSLRAGSL